MYCWLREVTLFRLESPKEVICLREEGSTAFDLGFNAKPEKRARGTDRRTDVQAAGVELGAVTSLESRFTLCDILNVMWSGGAAERQRADVAERNSPWSLHGMNE